MEVHLYSYFQSCDPWVSEVRVLISEVPGYHLLGQMSSQTRLQKLLQGLVSHELTAYLSIFNLFKLNK